MSEKTQITKYCPTCGIKMTFKGEADDPRMFCCDSHSEQIYDTSAMSPEQKEEFFCGVVVSKQKGRV